MRKRIWIAAAVALLALAGGGESWAKKGGGGKPGGGGDPPPATAEIAYITRDLMEMDADGANQRRVLRRVRRSDADVTWSPDGSRLLVQTDFQGPGLYVVDRASGDRTKIVDQASVYVGKPAWARRADSTEWVLFEDVGAGAKRDIFAVRADGSGRVNLTNTADRSETDPVWNGDATRFAAEVGSTEADGYAFDVYVYDVGSVDGSLQITAQENATPVGPLSRGEGGPGLSWSPAGDTLAVTRYDAPSNDYDIWTFVLGDPANATNVTDTGNDTWERQPSFSPDGTEIVYWHNTPLEQRRLQDQRRGRHPDASGSRGRGSGLEALVSSRRADSVAGTRPAARPS